MRAAVIDVGSNSVRLLLMERMDPGGAVYSYETPFADRRATRY